MSDYKEITLTPSSNSIISLDHVTKKYGTARGITDITLDIQKGEVFGFLGPNGAGKTTTIRVLLDLIRPTSGHASIFGLDTQKDTIKIKKRVGYLPGEFALYPNLTGGQICLYFANLRGGLPWENITKIAKRMDVDLGKKFRQYSRGNKQKIGIILAFMHKPELLILDEPTSGLDPLIQIEFYNMLKEAREAGSTVFFSSHILNEVEKICTRVGIIREGELVKVSNLQELIGLKVHHLEITFATLPPIEELQKIPGVDEAKVKEGTTVIIHVKPSSLDGLVKEIAKYNVTNLISLEPSLEEVFLHFFKK
jgi:ABC-2 type transport system ATP-binding protein